MNSRGEAAVGVKGTFRKMFIKLFRVEFPIKMYDSP